MITGPATLYDVIEVFDDGTERVIAEGKDERNAEAIRDMAVIRRGVEHSFFTIREVRDDRIPSAPSRELLETTHVVPMPAVAGWTEDQRLDYMEAHRKIMARRGGRIVKERRVRNTAFDNRGEKTSWEFVVEWSDDRT